jgi:hypothetical protein
LTSQLARELCAYIIEHGGVTYSIARGYVSEGYSVSARPDNERLLPAFDFNADDVDAYMFDHWDELSAPGTELCLGAWREGGEVYLDTPFVVADRAGAMSIAKLHDELAIYDLGMGVTIYAE